MAISLIPFDRLDFRTLGYLSRTQQNGALLDGFPRTKVQVECLKLLFDEMIALRKEFSDTPDVIHFKQPIFHIMVMFVDEAATVFIGSIVARFSR